MIQALLPIFPKETTRINDILAFQKKEGHVYYFNATMQGVKVLFEKFKEVDSGVHSYQMPSYMLTSIISRYLRSLIPSLGKSAAKIELYDTENYVSSWKSAILIFFYRTVQTVLSYVDRRLDSKTVQEIATGTYFLGKKVGRFSENL